MRKYLVILFFLTTQVALASSPVDRYLPFDEQETVAEKRVVNLLRLAFECELKQPWCFNKYKGQGPTDDMRVSHNADQVVAVSTPLSADLMEKLGYFYQDEPQALCWDTLSECRAPILERCIGAVSQFHLEHHVMSPKISLVQRCLQNHVLFSADEAAVAAGKNHDFGPPHIKYDAGRGSHVRLTIKQLILSSYKELDDSLTLHDCPVGTLLACARSLSLNLQQNADDPHPVLVAQTQRVIDAFPTVVETQPEFILTCMNLFLSRKLSVPTVKLDSWKGFVTTHEKLLKGNGYIALEAWYKAQNQSRTSARLSRASQSTLNVLSTVSGKLSPRTSRASGAEKTSPRSPRLSPKFSPRAGRANLTMSAPNPLRKSMSDDE